MLFLRKAQPILTSNVLTVLYLDDMDVTRWRMLKPLGRSCPGKVDLLMAGGAAGVLQVFLSCPLPATPNSPSPFIICLLILFFCRDGSSTVPIFGIFQDCCNSLMLVS